MTFYEAAIEVLLKAGRPLHYKKITEAAIQDKLLSHIGRTPEMTMSERLDQEVRKDQNSPVMSTSPGVFMIREEFIQKLQNDVKRRARNEALDKAAEKREKDVAVEQTEEVEEKAAAPAEGRDNRRRRRRSSRSRRSTRNSRNDTKASDETAQSSTAVEPSEAKLDAKSDASVDDSAQNGRRSSNSRRRSSRSNNRRSDKNGHERKSQSRRNNTQSNAITVGEQKHLSEGPVRLDGIAQAAVTVLQDGQNKPLLVKELSDEIFKRKLARFHTHDPATTVQAAIANDNQIREQRGHRPLFIQYEKNCWGLSEWGLSKHALIREQQILSLSEEIRQDAIEHLGEAFTKIKPEALEQIALTLLERLGYRNIKVSKRSAEGSVFFTGDWRQGLSDVRVCIEVVANSSQELQADAVTNLRGTLHHYSASEGVIIHLGSIHTAAVKESREEKLAPITLIDRTTFVELLIKNGIGVQTYHTPITMVDMAFISALTD